MRPIRGWFSAPEAGLLEVACSVLPEPGDGRAVVEIGSDEVRAQGRLRRPGG